MTSLAGTWEVIANQINRVILYDATVIDGLWQPQTLQFKMLSFLWVRFIQFLLGYGWVNVNGMWMCVQYINCRNRLSTLTFWFQIFPVWYCYDWWKNQCNYRCLVMLLEMFIILNTLNIRNILTMLSTKLYSKDQSHKPNQEING